MPPLYTRADALREYLTGVTTDSDTQPDALASLGTHKSSSEAKVFGVAIANAVSNVTITYASGGNPRGTGVITAASPTSLTWTAPGAVTPGPPQVFTPSSTFVIEAADNPGQYLRIIAGLSNFGGGPSNVTLSPLVDNAFALGEVVNLPDNSYLCTAIRNESAVNILQLIRWMTPLGTSQVSDVLRLPATGAGQVTTSGVGGFADWPAFGWAHVVSSAGVLREVIYYTQRTNTTLTVPATGRGVFSVGPVLGNFTDFLTPVSGVRIGLDPVGKTTGATGFQGIANRHAAPTGVTWNYGRTQAGGLNIGTLTPNQWVVVWMHRQCPGGLVSSTNTLNQFSQSFLSQ